jgi:hypothetical protein
MHVSKLSRLCDCVDLLLYTNQPLEIRSLSRRAGADVKSSLEYSGKIVLFYLAS